MDKNLLKKYPGLADRILLPDAPLGEDKLADILHAMERGKMLRLHYHGYWRSKKVVYEVEPYFVRLYNNRWYLVANNPELGKMMVCTLERIEKLTVMRKDFTLPADCSAKGFFEDNFGIIKQEGLPAEEVQFRASVRQAAYLRATPLHPSQTETLEEGGTSVFTVRVSPTSDFIRELLWNGDDIEVLEPEWLRDKVGRKVNRMWKKYFEMA